MGLSESSLDAVDHELVATCPESINATVLAAPITMTRARHLVTAEIYADYYKIYLILYKYEFVANTSFCFQVLQAHCSCISYSY